MMMIIMIMIMIIIIIIIEKYLLSFIINSRW